MDAYVHRSIVNASVSRWRRTRRSTPVVAPEELPGAEAFGFEEALAASAADGGPVWAEPEGAPRRRPRWAVLAAAIACPEPFLDDVRQSHLTWRLAGAGAADGTVTVGEGWLRASRVVGSALVSVGAPADERALAERILDAAAVCALAEQIVADRPTIVDAPGGPTALVAGEVLLMGFIGHTGGVRMVRLPTGGLRPVRAV